MRMREWNHANLGILSSYHWAVKMRNCCYGAVLRWLNFWTLSMDKIAWGQHFFPLAEDLINWCKEYHWTFWYFGEAIWNLVRRNGDGCYSPAKATHTNETSSVQVDNVRMLSMVEDFRCVSYQTRRADCPFTWSERCHWGWTGLSGKRVF